MAQVPDVSAIVEQVKARISGSKLTSRATSKSTGIATATVSTLLTKLAKPGEVSKAQGGYRLPN